MDHLQITALSTKTRIGVHAWEQRILQQLLLDIHIPYDFKNSQDDLAKTLDYDALCQRVTTFVESNHFQLIETVANEVAAFLIKEFAIKTLTLTVSKPHAIKNAGMISVTVER
ncbi:MAG: dihydroneopterin aldolase [Legionellales bacterium]|nr:dihydroneopterin aldolase [Legionellales bacterium]